MKYRKKPVVIEAFQWTRERRLDNKDWPWWLSQAWQKERDEVGAFYIGNHGLYVAGDDKEEVLIYTLEGSHQVKYGDFIIQGVKGELYPCREDIFAATYEVFDGAEKVAEAAGWSKLVVDRVQRTKEALRNLLHVLEQDGGFTPDKAPPEEDGPGEPWTAMERARKALADMAGNEP